MRFMVLSDAISCVRRVQRDRCVIRTRTIASGCKRESHSGAGAEGVSRGDPRRIMTNKTRCDKDIWERVKGPMMEEVGIERREQLHSECATDERGGWIV